MLVVLCFQLVCIIENFPNKKLEKYYLYVVFINEIQIYLVRIQILRT